MKNFICKSLNMQFAHQLFCIFYIHRIPSTLFKHPSYLPFYFSEVDHLNMQFAHQLFCIFYIHRIPSTLFKHPSYLPFYFSEVDQIHINSDKSIYNT